MTHAITSSIFLMFGLTKMLNHQHGEIHSLKSGWFQQKHRTFPARHTTISATKQGLNTRADCLNHRKSGHFRDKVVKSRDLAYRNREASCQIVRVRMVWIEGISWAQGDGFNDSLNQKFNGDSLDPDRYHPVQHHQPPESPPDNWRTSLFGG